jgi:hypothetical protein
MVYFHRLSEIPFKQSSNPEFTPDFEPVSTDEVTVSSTTANDSNGHFSLVQCKTIHSANWMVYIDPLSEIPFKQSRIHTRF